MTARSDRTGVADAPGAPNPVSAGAPLDVVYCGIGDDLGYEREILARRGLGDRICLREVELPGRSRREVVAALSGAAAVVVENVEIDADVLAGLPDLKIVALQSIGVNSVDLTAAARAGVQVSNAPGFCVEEVAAHTVGLILDLLRHITFYDRQVQAGGWDSLPAGQAMPRRVRGLTVGLVFFGAIPRAMVPVLRALGMRVIAYAPGKSAEVLTGHGVEPVADLAQLLQESDVVSLHAPLTDTTHHLVGARELALMKPDAVLVNTARGPVVDEAALVAALRDGTIAAAGIDVIDDEVTASTALRGLPNVVITPHAAFLSQESYLQARQMALDCVLDVLVEGQAPRYPARVR